jgi:hypothetical protein
MLARQRWGAGKRSRGLYFAKRRPSMSETRPSSMLLLITVNPTCGRTEVEGDNEAGRRSKLKNRATHGRKSAERKKVAEILNK